MRKEAFQAGRASSVQGITPTGNPGSQEVVPLARSVLGSLRLYNPPHTLPCPGPFPAESLGTFLVSHPVVTAKWLLSHSWPEGFLENSTGRSQKKSLWVLPHARISLEDSEMLGIICPIICPGLRAPKELPPLTSGHRLHK